MYFSPQFDFKGLKQKDDSYNSSFMISASSSYSKKQLFHRLLTDWQALPKELNSLLFPTYHTSASAQCLEGYNKAYHPWWSMPYITTTVRRLQCSCNGSWLKRHKHDPLLKWAHLSSRFSLMWIWPIVWKHKSSKWQLVPDTVPPLA